ncbi:hypothetical protein C8Q73DRAFT_204492 [Cubamyces lactineus]|nr:hypothetical protein C8Q73DRAFT_204492 [Cubamyces lactineus]
MAAGFPSASNPTIQSTIGAGVSSSTGSTSTMAQLPDASALSLHPPPSSSLPIHHPPSVSVSAHSPSPSLKNSPSPGHSAHQPRPSSSAPAQHPTTSSNSSPLGKSHSGSGSATQNTTSSPASGGDPSPSSGRPSASDTGPTNDDIEAVIQMAMASSNSPRATNPPRDTRTQLFVGNLPYRVRWQDLKDLFRRAGTVLRADVSLGPDNRSRGYGTVLLATAEDAGRAVDMFNGYTWQTRTLEVRPDRMGEELNVPGANPAVAPYGVGLGAMGMGVGVGALGALGGYGAAAGNMGVFGTPLVPSLSPAPGAALSGAGSPVAVAAAAAAAAGGSALASPAPTVPRFPGLSPFAANAGLAAEDADASGSRPSTTVQASRNLFVGNLPFHIQWQDLKDLFRQAGAVQRADVALGADGRSRGFGTVSFANEADAERAVRMFNGFEYNGRPLKVHFDKFAAPSSSSAPLVGPGAMSSPHSPASFAFSHTPTHSLSSPVSASLYGQHPQPALSRSSSLAQQLLQQQLEHGRGATPASLAASRRPSGQMLGFGAAGTAGTSAGALDENVEQESLAQQLAQKLSLASPVQPHSPTSQQQQQQQTLPFGRQGSQQQFQQQQQEAPTHIPIPPAIQSPYTFDFLHSGPTTPYDVYDLGTYQRMNMAMSMGGGMMDGAYMMQNEQPHAFHQTHQPSVLQHADAQHQQQLQREDATAPGASSAVSPTFSTATASADTTAASSVAQKQHRRDSSKSQNTPGSGSNSTSPPSLATTSGQSSSQTQATSPTTSSRSHATPQQQHQTPQHHHHHPAHPGPIALPPPPPVTAFPVPPPHTLSPQYMSMSPHMAGHPMSPLHHPMMGMSMPMMTPHGLPPITPSMPSFTFLPQPSPGLPASPAGVDGAGGAAGPGGERPTMHGHMQHVMTPFSPFSPGVTMSPGAFWGRPGTGANPFINPAVGAPVRPGYYPYPHQQQQPPPQQQQQQPGEQQQGDQEGRPPDGYFPPIPVGREEPAGYFPWMPPPPQQHQHQHQSTSHGDGGTQRTSGLANEILRDDSSSGGSANTGSGSQQGTKESPNASDGTATTTGTARTSGTGTSAGTSWRTDSSEGAVEDALGPSVAAVNGHANGNGYGHGKPRAYSAETNASMSGGSGSGSGSGSGTVERGALHRADSDPVRTVLG